MNRSNKKSIWNRRKGETRKEKDEALEDDELLNDEFREQELIARVQQKFGVSREKARNIIKNSELI